MSGIRIVHLLPPAWDLKRQRQRDCDRTRKGLVRGAAKASAGTAEAKLVCGGEEWEAVQRALAGNRDALATLFAPDQARLYRSAFSLLRNKEDAQDALQDALLSAYLKLRSFEGRSRFSTWLTRIVLNAALMNRRKLHSHPHVSLDEILDEDLKFPPAAVIDEGPDPERSVAKSRIATPCSQQYGGSHLSCGRLCIFATFKVFPSRRPRNSKASAPL